MIIIIYFSKVEGLGDVKWSSYVKICFWTSMCRTLSWCPESGDKCGKTNKGTRILSAAKMYVRECIVGGPKMHHKLR